MLRGLRRWATTVVLGLLGVLGVVILVAGTLHIFGGHDDPSLAGKGRLHDPYIEKVPCRRLPTHTCYYDKTVKLELPNGQNENVAQDNLYALVRRTGPIPVEVEWVKDVGESTRVRYRGRWYRTHHLVAAGDDVSTIVAMGLLGLPLAFFCGGWFLIRVLPGEDEPESQAS